LLDILSSSRIHVFEKLKAEAVSISNFIEAARGTQILGRSKGTLKFCRLQSISIVPARQLTP
jgi:hypothetical protein